MYGVPIYTYCRTYRLQIAEKLLREGQLSVAEIAAKIGYINPNKFTSAFCSEYKMTPTEYKKDVQMDRKYGPKMYAKWKRMWRCTDN